ncbi:hypothetical protein [Ruegeria sp.]|uniref:hypothetical protein n=1 Tax=Ruegeria sp. TaxID=1879320 RepID=UPI003AFFF3EF
MLPTPDNSECSRQAKVRVHEYPDGQLVIFHGPRCIGRYQPDGSPITQEDSKHKVA